jgi:hypothetical protein
MTRARRVVGVVAAVAVGLTATSCRAEVGTVPSDGYVVAVNDRGLFVGEQGTGASGWALDTASKQSRTLTSGSEFDLPGSTYTVTGVSNAGQVTGWVWQPPMGDHLPSQGHQEALVWDASSGARHMLDPGFEHHDAVALAVNEEGFVAGRVTVVTGTSEGETTHREMSVRWNPDRSHVDVLDAGGWSTEPVAINGKGVVVGRHWLGKSYVWDPGTGTMRLLDVPGATYTAAAAINDSGVIVGTATFGTAGDAPRRAVRWAADGTVTLLDDLGGGYLRLRAINAAGVAVGQSSRADGLPHAVRVDATSSAAVDLSPGSSATSDAFRITPTGQVFGVDGNALVRWDPDPAP